MGLFLIVMSMLGVALIKILNGHPVVARKREVSDRPDHDAHHRHRPRTCCCCARSHPAVRAVTGRSRR